MAIDAPHPEASAFVEPLVGLLVSRPMDRSEVRVEMAKDDRPRQRPYAVVMPDHRVVFLKGLLQGPTSLRTRHRASADPATPQRAAPDAREACPRTEGTGRRRSRFRRQIIGYCFAAGIMDYIDRRLGWFRS